MTTKQKSELEKITGIATVGFNTEQLRQQAALVGQILDATPSLRLHLALTEDEHDNLEGLWNFLHAVLDQSEPPVTVLEENDQRMTVYLRVSATFDKDSVSATDEAAFREEIEDGVDEVIGTVLDGGGALPSCNSYSVQSFDGVQQYRRTGAGR